MSLARLPALPTEFRAKTNWEIFYVSWRNLLIIPAAGWFSLEIYNQLWLTDNLWLKVATIPLIALSTMLSGWFLGDLDVALAHDGGHGMLHKNLRVSFLIGIVLSSIVPGALAVVFSDEHWEHHKTTNTDEDPYALNYAELKRKGRVFNLFYFGILRFIYNYQVAFQYLQGKSKVSFLSERETKFFTALNIVLNISATIAWCGLLYFGPEVFILVFALPWIWNLTSASLASLPFHTGMGIDLQTTRDFTHPFAVFLYAGNNYHIEHHMYPFVQRSKTAKLHKHLSSLDFFKANNCTIDNRPFSFLSLVFTTDQPVFKNGKNIAA